MFTMPPLARAVVVALPVLGALHAAPLSPSRTMIVRAPLTSHDIAGAAFAVSRADSVVIRGTVRDAANGRGLEGASVLLMGSTSSIAASPVGINTSADGHYVLAVRGVTRGALLTVQVRRIGYIGVVHSVSVTADSLTVDFQLTASTNQLSAVTVVGPVGKVNATRAAGAQAMASPTLVAKRRADMAPGTANRLERDALAARDRSREFGSGLSREQYDRIEDNPFLAVRVNPRSTFSIDVDRAAYGNVRRFLTQGQKPPADAVRIEELVNYFPYTLESPRGAAPIAITTEVAAAPWQPRHRLVRIALQARRIDTDKLPASNLVFLIDVSGSMMSADKLPLVKQSLRLLVDQLREQDRVAIVVYAGNAGLVLPSTPGTDKARIAEAIDRLEAGGSTAGGAGIRLAYQTAKDNFQREGNNRVILATDGDFNVGASSDAEMERLIESKRSEGTYLTVLGFGTGNYQDAKMEKLAKKGNGNYAYVDNLAEARKVLVQELGATLVTVANDVKLQVEFNPAAVQGYRLIGYEDRLLRDEDFTDDKKDAGDIGAGHTVTALYEVVPVGVEGTVKLRGADSLRYTATEPAPVRPSAAELMYVKLRYKRPGDSTSRLMSQAVPSRITRTRTTDDFRFAASVASFGMLLRDSEHKGNATSASVLEMARGALGDDAGGYRAEFVRLVERWQEVTRGVANRE